ncbi:MAG: hypothetical protein A3B96_02760 [Candidatus Spechtbacteria bacterium RIFCSPHIGHO2_02_FULL_43_15b]|uniref:Uncharacterized protein n=1 Tax=Candidatus Spechtbacteria bacterium RIFCSPHIGHO2_01_FULL_43_30 TaxID=1802158 RepID=A0A1G2H765_9BACT|nr:MAG: hypothetical protein A2827_02915 [Candidatus Spechtbacteria bacterium RIFCSPHIGHO2_01_FULL_43_30]OGZ60218.1 MAG: hypothetical protein A3B96_02760 [Candidatus Spechtbacteria bacterium RIFCSPHIGHO2_02_FULL_43_15b]
MTLAPHILVGAAIAANISNPIAGLFLAFLSHFALDRIPHSEYSIESLRNAKITNLKKSTPTLRIVLLDIFAGCLILITSAIIGEGQPDFSILALGGFLGILPDGLSAVYFLMPGNKILKTVFDIHRKIHFPKGKHRPALRVGIASQIVASAVALYFIVF